MMPLRRTCFASVNSPPASMGNSRYTRRMHPWHDCYVDDSHITSAFPVPAMIPEVTGADLEAARGAVMGMTRDAQRVLVADFAPDVVGRLIGADVLFDVERDDVRVLAAADVVLRHLGAGHNEHPVFALGPLRFRTNVGQICVEVLFAHAEVAPAERREAAGPREQVLLHQDVIRDGKDVEPAGLAIEIDDLGDRQPAVAPARMDVEVAEQEWFIPGHQILTSR